MKYIDNYFRPEEQTVTEILKDTHYEGNWHKSFKHSIFPTRFDLASTFLTFSRLPDYALFSVLFSDCCLLTGQKHSFFADLEDPLMLLARDLLKVKCAH